MRIGPSVGGASVGAGCGRQHEVLRGERDRGRDRRLVHDERDVHRPVGAPGFAVLARAVERVDDPHAFRVDARRVVLRLLGEDRVVGPVLAQERRG